MRKGKLVIIEGADCSGKSTFVRFLKEREPGVIYTNEPGGNSYGRKIRHLLLTEDGAEDSDNLTKFHLYWASKAENFRKVILPNLDEGKVVVSDRFEGSTYAYQVSEEPGLEDLFWQTRAACFGSVEPVYLYFDVGVSIQIARASARVGEQNYFDRRGVKYREQINQAYLKFVADPRIIARKIDASLPMEEMLSLAYETFLSVVSE